VTAEREPAAPAFRAQADVRPDAATLAAFAGVVLTGGLNAIAVRQTVLELAPFWGAAMRFVAAGVIMAVLVLVLRRSFPRGRSLTGAMLYGAVGFGASYGFMYPGFRDVPAGTGMVLIALVPLMTFGLAIAHGQERFRLQGLIGALIALAGVGIVFAAQLSANVPLASLVVILLGTASIAESAVIAKMIPRSDPFGTNAVAMLTGAAILLIVAIVAGDPFVLPSQAPTWLAVGYLVIVGSVVMFALFLYALARWTASGMSYMTLLLPIVTILAAAVLTGEPITLPVIAGGAVILLGVYVGAFLKIRRGRSSASALPECFPIDACPEVVPVVKPVPVSR
jgi:drug/metabolite transporter (DMT)-like permease